jgi:hypothetical protein
LERNEGLSFGTAYDFTTGPAAQAGGYGGGNPDPISEGTAWLYEAFSNGSLANYSYATATAQDLLDRASSGRALQNAIWALEDEQAVDNSNIFIQAVVTQFGDLATAKANYSGTTVGVLNPTNPAKAVTDPFYRRQSVLINLPDNGMAVMLLGGSLMLIGAARRRLA